jgi:MIP family channel proteins
VRTARLGPYIAELVATFALVFAGCGAIIIDTTSHGQVTHVGIAITFGLIIAAMIYATGHISGAHINPAVTLAFALTRHFPLVRVPLYWLAQLVGALLAALLLRALFGNVAHLGTTLPAGSDGQSLVLEMVLTFFLMFVIMAVATDNRAVGQAAALAIGGTVLLDAMFGGPISGASMNPARSLGPALVSGTLSHLWIYILGPASGALLGAFAYELARGEEPDIGLTPTEEGIDDADRAAL